MRRSIAAFSAITAGAVLSLLAVPHAFGILSLPAAATVSLDDAVDEVLATPRPDRQQQRAMNRVQRFLHPHRGNAAQPHQRITDARKILQTIGDRFETQITNPDFDVDTCNEIGAWVDDVGVALGRRAAADGRMNERRVVRAFAKADRLFDQAVDARNRGNCPRTLRKMARCMKQLQRIARFLGVDIATL